MNKSNFPYLTLENIVSIGAAALKQGAAWFPEQAPALNAVATMLPVLEHVPVVAAGVQHLLDGINNVTGAEPPAV